MPAFKRLTRRDLDTLTRAELLRRITAESDYWDRKCRRGLSDADAAAHQEFSAILYAALDPGEALDHAIQYVQGRGDNGYWDHRPGDHQREAGRITDAPGTDKFGFGWDHARTHIGRTLDVPAGKAADVTEWLAREHLLLPYQVVQTERADLTGLLAGGEDR